jgi:hypothetical protein
MGTRGAILTAEWIDIQFTWKLVLLGSIATCHGRAQVSRVPPVVVYRVVRGHCTSALVCAGQKSRYASGPGPRIPIRLDQEQVMYHSYDIVMMQ